MKRCMIYLDRQQMSGAIEMLEVLRQMYPDEATIACGVAINHGFDDAMGAFDEVIAVRHDGIADYDQVAVASVMEEIQKAKAFDCILIPATPFGRMLAPRLAMALHTGLVADVTAISHREEGLEMIRPAFSGRLLAGITSRGDGPVMMSIRQGVFGYYGARNKTTRVEAYVPVTVRTGGIRVLDTREKEAAFDIRESNVLISGGGGVLRHFSKLGMLADELGGQVSASRRIVDNGIATRNIQVGQSGKTVSPDLYMALGIYGAIQHVEGLKNVKHIISVNTNRHAPICSLSDIVVEGDAAEFIERLTAKIKENK